MAASNGGRLFSRGGNALRLKDFAWTRQPLACATDAGRMEIVTRPHTDLWLRTYYHFRNDTASCCK